MSGPETNPGTNPGTGPGTAPDTIPGTGPDTGARPVPAGPDISIVIPVYNRAHSIADTLRSLAGVKGHPCEVLLVDDGSQDQSVQVMENTIAELGLGATMRVIRQSNGGPGAARNTGVAASRGRWIAFLDSDDVWLPWTLPHLRAALDRPDPPALLFLAVRFFRTLDELAALADAPAVITRHPTALDMRLAPDRLKIIASCNLVIRRDVFTNLGGFTTATRCSEDTDLLYRAGLLGPVDSVVAPAMVGFRDGNPDSLGRQMDAVVGGIVFLLGREATGAYPGDAHRRQQALAQSAAYTIQRMLRFGYPRQAYRLWWHSRTVMVADGRARQLVTLALTPLLSLVRPRKYRFRWVPLKADQPTEIS